MQDAFAIVPAWLPGWFSGGVGVGFGVGGSWGIWKAIQWLMTFFFGRVDKRTENIDKRDAASSAATLAAVELLRSELRRLEAKAVALETRVAALETENDGLKAKALEDMGELIRLRAIEQGKGEGRQQVQREQSAAALISKGAA